jgi:hypothetical protein
MLTYQKKKTMMDVIVSTIMKSMAAILYIYSSNNQPILDSVYSTSVHLTSIYGKPKNNKKKKSFHMKLQFARGIEISAKNK